MKIHETDLGFEILHENYLLFFGKKESSLESLKKAYPQFTFKRLKQIHSDAVVETLQSSDDYTIHADAHYTSEQNLALCSITADCIPALAIDPINKRICAIHAGWRGVANRIIPKSLEKMKEEGSSLADMICFLGPHIRQDSFEVGNDVRDTILLSLGPLPVSEVVRFFKPKAADKALLDLSLVAKEQLLHSGISTSNIHDIQMDTCASELFHSYRRDRNQAGRQISFVVRKSL